MSKIKCETHSGGAYWLGAIGAAVYYIQTTVGFGAAIVGILKAIVWPAFLVFELLKFIGV
jgi:hypothetical protein